MPALASLSWKGIVAGRSNPVQLVGLERSALDQSRAVKDRLLRLAVRGALAATADAD
jgi:hypothetical protein